jgi:hypothetical protein
MSLTRVALVCALAAVFQGVAVAAPIFRLTEAYVGIDGSDGTPDWIEVTNFGDMAGDTATLWYDDENPTVASGVQLPSFSLDPGASAVFLVTGDVEPTSIDEFTAIWGSGIDLFAAAGGGGLGQGGDVVNIILGDGTLVDSLEFEALANTNVSSVEDPTGLAMFATPSVIGVNGAFASNPYANTGAGSVGGMVTLVGSPGAIINPTAAVPEPSTLAVVAAAGLALAAFRFCRS